MKRVYVNEQWCLGCHLCEYNCAFANSSHMDMVKALKDQTIYPRIRVENDDRITYAVSCRHCTDPMCIKSCISGALSKSSDGTVVIDKTKCIGCYTCIFVLLDNGRQIPYDALYVAIGSSPFILPFAGLDTVKNKYTFMTENDTLQLEQAIDEHSQILIVGAGLIGLKCAEGLCKRVKSITVCDLATRVLSSILDDSCASMMQKKLEEHFDVLVLAVGVRPNISLVKDCNGETDRGILIDNSMHTSLPDIFAAGDCTQGCDATAGEKRIIAILPNAYMQGHCAGLNMAGNTNTFDNAIPMNAIGFFGLHALTAGKYTGEMYEEKSENSIKRLFVEDNLLVGFMLIGNVDRAGIYTSLIREKTPLNTLNFDLLKKSPSLIPFSSKYRGKKLGGTV